jgi:hypothetical protein
MRISRPTDNICNSLISRTNKPKVFPGPPNKDFALSGFTFTADAGAGSFNTELGARRLGDAAL